MSKIAYILLGHRDPATIAATARTLCAAGDMVAIHFDASASAADWAALQAAVAELPGVILVAPRLRCGWGDWSLVAATLASLRQARDAFPEATHFYLLSGDCAPIKSAAHIHARLDARDCDWIECHDFHDSDWIKTGPREERLIYRHPFNERRHPRLFYLALAVQRRLGLRRRPPRDLRVMIGSQWWCLRRGTVQALLDFCERRADVPRFFASTWIPDETFFQTLVPHLVPRAQIDPRPLTFLLFTDYGMPVVFHDDHHDMLLGQDHLFARKISPNAHDLRRRLGALYLDKVQHFDISNAGGRLFDYLTTRGRIGLRAAPRFWEAHASVGRDRDLLLITCKKWHVAKRLLAALARESNLPTAGFLFNEADTPLPDLGGITRGLEKRARHRRALVRMLFEYHGTDRLALCVDPASFDLIADFHADRCRTRLLEITCDFSDAYLAGHARRAGLAGAHTDAATMAQLLPTLRRDFRTESDRIADAGLDGVERISQAAPCTANAAALAAFFDLPQDKALRLARTARLFDD